MCVFSRAKLITVYYIGDPGELLNVPGYEKDFFFFTLY